jgi:hypothetical protein
MDNPVWSWLVRTRLSAYNAAAAMGERTGPGTAPGWTFDRFGCSKTVLDDGRVIRIAGEHEDYYDPDFFIYNDVVVIEPDGAVTVHGYPPDVFPPTDFHTAVRVGDQIYIVGNLGYAGERAHGATLVFRLDLGRFTITRAPSAASGGPGWIHEHIAELAPDGAAIIVRRGIVERAGTDAAGPTLIDNIDDWAYHLHDGSWHRLTQRPWQQWSVRRDDGESLALFEMSCMAFEAEIGKPIGPPTDVGARKFDATVYADLYRPPIDHEREERSWGEDPDDDGFRTGDNARHDEARIHIGEARIRYAPDMREVTVKVEGPIDPSTARAVIDDLVAKLEQLQATRCLAERVA